MSGPVNGYLTSYVGLFVEQSNGAPRIDRVSIPIIQRDYAQGRTDAATAQIRTDFITFLLESLAAGTPVGLDFIYGKVADGVFHPLDGQQRLTTLYLIHWYVASRAGELNVDAPWTHFTYETRPSARRFCESLVQNPFPSVPDDPASLAPSPAKWIEDQPWFLYTWRNDPTIKSMLVMIDAIHEEWHSLGPALDAQACWERLTDAESPAISFYLLPLEDMRSEDELYIKMNSRGKPLTPFENFKAHFEQDIRDSGRADHFARRIDGPWSDLMWRFRGEDDIVDDEFMRYIDYITEICELRDLRD